MHVSDVSSNVMPPAGHVRRRSAPSRRRSARWWLALLFLPSPVYAQGTSDPWDNAVQVLQAAFTSTIARGLSLVAIVVGGLMFAFGEGQSKRTLAGIIFGVGMAVGAVNFMAWLFP
jgi:type IV secretion system protein TrbC